MHPAPIQPGSVGEISRPGQIVVGVVICGVAMFISGISVFLFFSLPYTYRFLLVAIPTLVVCGWILNKGISLITGRRRMGGLFAPWALRVGGVVFFLFPFCGIFTGYYHEHPPLMLGLQAASDLAISLALFALASRRAIQLHNQSPEPVLSSGTSPAGQEPRHP
jgi:hypothetical protein